MTLSMRTVQLAALIVGILIAIPLLIFTCVATRQIRTGLTAGVAKG